VTGRSRRGIPSRRPMSGPLDQLEQPLIRHSLNRFPSFRSRRSNRRAWTPELGEPTQSDPHQIRRTRMFRIKSPQLVCGSSSRVGGNYRRRSCNPGPLRLISDMRDKREGGRGREPSKFCYGAIQQPVTTQTVLALVPEPPSLLLLPVRTHGSTALHTWAVAVYSNSTSARFRLNRDQTHSAVSAYDPIR